MKPTQSHESLDTHFNKPDKDKAAKRSLFLSKRLSFNSLRQALISRRVLAFVSLWVLGFSFVLFLRSQAEIKQNIKAKTSIDQSGFTMPHSTNGIQKSIEQNVKGDNDNEMPNASPALALNNTPSVFEEKLSEKDAKNPQDVDSRRRFLNQEEDKADEEEHEDYEKEQKERAFWSEERDRFEFDLLKDPVTGTIPRTSALMASEAAQRMRANQEGSINTRAVPVTVLGRGPSNLGGRTRAIGIDKRNPNIMLAGSVSSGVYRSTNGGASWTRVAPIGQIHNVTAIAQDPRAGFEDTWYYGGGEASGNSANLGSSYRGFGIWKSTNNGLTWAPLASTQSILEQFDNPFDYVSRIVVDPATGNVYAAGANTILQSTNGGSTWSIVLGTFTVAANNYTDIIVTPTGQFYAAIDGRDANNGVWTSATGALGSWTRIAGTGALTSPATWNAQNTYGRIVLAYAPSNPNTVFALYWNGISHTSTNQVPEAGLYKWNQGTTTWTNLSANLPDEPGYSSGNDPFAVQGGYDLVVAVKPDDENTVFIGGTNVYRSTSGFTNTTATKRIGGYNSPANYALYPNHHPDNHIFLFANGDNNTLYTGDDGGIQKADITVPTVSWTPLNNNYITYQYYHADIDPANGSPVIAGGAQDNGTTVNSGGTSFNSIFGGDGCQTAIISYTSATNFNIIASSQYGNLVRLIAPSAGFSIYPRSSSQGIFVTYYQLDQDNTNYLYYADNAALYRTRNASKLTNTSEGDPATAWQKMPSIGLVGNIRSMATSRDNAYCNADYTASDPNRKLYIGTEAGRVYRLNDPAFAASTSAAVNITPPTATPNSLCSSIAVNPFDDNEILVTFSNYNVPSVFHTLNANSATPTWTQVEGPANTPLQLGSARSCIITQLGSTKTYMVGNSTGLYTTQALNGASTVWEQVGSNEINYAVCASMRLRVSDNTIVLGTHGNGMFELKLPAADLPLVARCKNLSFDFTYGGSVILKPEDVLESIAQCSPIKSLTIDRTLPFNSSDAPVKTVILTATDQVGNMSKCEAKIFVSQSELPAVICPDNKTINSEDFNGSVPATAATSNMPNSNLTSTDKIYKLGCNTGGNSIRPDGFPNDAAFNSTLASNATGIVVRTFSATFLGGISSTCYQQFYIKKPNCAAVTGPQNVTAVCLNGVPNIKPEDLANANTRTSGTGFPRFSNGTFLTDVSQGLTSSYTDAPLSNGVIVRTWNISDNCGTSCSTFKQNITIPSCVIPQIAISGSIKQETGENVAAMVKIFSQQDPINTTEASFYNFPSVPVGQSYRLTAERNNDIFNGVTSYDIAMISKYILGLEPAKSPYQLIAMDVNRNGEVDASDMLMIRNLILRKATNFPNNTAWRFIPRSYVFQNPSNPFAEDFPEVISFNKPTFSISDADFVAVKIGDANSTAKTDLTAVQVRSAPEKDYIDVPDGILEAGKTYHIPLKTQIKSLTALQFALNIDKNAVESFSVEKGDLESFGDGNLNILRDKGLVSLAWASVKATNENTLFTLVVKVRKQISIRELISLNSGFSDNLAYNTEGSEKQLALFFSGENVEKPQFDLHQNRPNPFNNDTQISFILPEPNNAELTVYDITGRVIYTLNRVFNKGFNEVTLDNSVVKTSGVYFYRLKADKYSAVKRMQRFN